MDLAKFTLPRRDSSWNPIPTTFALLTRAFVQRERAEAARGTQGFFPGAPDLAIEVISPSDLYTDVEEKVADWLTGGTLAVIVVDPRRRTVKVHRSLTDAVVLTEPDVLGVDDIVPGWQMPVSDMFR